MGQMLRGGQAAAGDSFLGFDVLLTEAKNGPAIDCDEGRLDVTLEVSTDKGKSYRRVGSDALNVACDASRAPDVALVVDNSGSQQGQLDVIREATRAMADEVMALGGRTSVVRVSTESRVMHGLSDEMPSLQGAISDFSVSNGWTALYDGVRMGNETLEGARVVEDDNGFATAEEFCGIDPNRAIVVFTDGRENNSMDEHSSADYPGDGVDTSFQDVKQLKVRGTKTPIYTVGLGDDVDHVELNRLGVHSGGKHHALQSLDELAATFNHITGYTKRRFKVCGDLRTEHCGRLDVRMSYSWSDGGRALQGAEETRITVPCSD
jgi:Mg-chelatase subunit ChlD